MSEDSVKFDGNVRISLEYLCDLKEEFQGEYYPDNKVCISETAITDSINISSTEINEYMRNYRISKYDNHIKTDISEVNDSVSNKVKIENEICPVGMQIEFDNELLFCNHCHEVYQDYCTKCRVLIHILNERPSYNTYNKIRALPKYMLETRELNGHLGIFSLKVIPDDVRFGPFTGLDSIRGSCLSIKGGKFVVSDDILVYLNWMQYINPARNNYEQNLSPFQYEDKLYYCSTRRIQAGEELLVYFGEEYENNLLKNVEMDFVPITKNDVENVFACTFCCLGFRSKEYLAEHKAVCHSEASKIFSVEELAQCPFCKIYMETKEYLEQHKDYCCEINAKHCCVATKPEISEIEMEERSSLRSKYKRWKRGIYKCTQCKFKTMYNVDFRHHINEHYEVKMYKCGICDRRYKGKESLKAHVERIHVDNEGRYSTNIKNIEERCPHTHDNGKRHCSKCKFQTRNKCHPKSQIKQPNRGKYKCANCEFKTCYRTNLKRHMKIKHLMAVSYKCAECEFETNEKSYLNVHIEVKHNGKYYKCMECEFKTNYKSYLQVHIKAKHLEQNDYKCMECEYKTNYKSNLETHIKAKHHKEKGYKCMECEYKTYFKLDLKRHMKQKHFNEQRYKCLRCEYKANYKANLVRHIEAKHLKEKGYKCMECEYKTHFELDLKRHIKRKHFNEKRYKCLKCEYKANIKSYLKRHMKAKHLKEKDYQCMECQFKTSYRSSLEEHIKRKHLKQNYYKCTECEFETNIKARLNRHMKTKHSKEYDYKCMECEYMTNYKSVFEKHIKAKHLKQNDYTCMECEFKTNNKSYLQVHIKAKHLKQNEYKCVECEFKTNYKTSLEGHIKAKHLEQYDYKCAECEFKTNNKANLAKHLNAKHLKQNII